MQVRTDVSLKDYSTMRIGGIAKALVHVSSKQDLLDAVAWAEEHKLPLLVLGGGSNVIFSDGYPGLVIINRIRGFSVIADNPAGTTIQIGAGESWDKIVERTVAMGLHGIEFLSAIPGTTGATPVQNVGAYGAEIAQVFVELEAYDITTRRFVTLSKDDCQFTYRNSIFKTPTHRRYIIVSVTLRLTKEMPKPPFYASLQHYLDEHAVTTYTPGTIRQAVIAVREHRLPDPAKIANTGSFFKNPMVPHAQASTLAAKYPDMPQWPLPDGRIKLAAGWLIDQAGLRGYHAHGLKTYENHALVIINEHATTYRELRDFCDEIITTVNRKFNITLEQEPELL